MAELYQVTEADLSAAFTEWDRRYREEPERFESEAVHLLKSTPETYGAAVAPYLLFLLGHRDENGEPVRTDSRTLGEVLADPGDSRASWRQEGESNG